MPLKQSKSKQAFESNIKAEMDSGKSQKQSLAIAYAVKRRAQNKAMGGMIEPEEDTELLDNDMESPWQDMSADEDLFLSDDEEMESEPKVENDGRLDRIMRKQMRKR